MIQTQQKGRSINFSSAINPLSESGQVFVGSRGICFFASLALRVS